MFGEVTGKWVLLGTTGKSGVHATLLEALWKYLAKHFWSVPFTPFSLLLSLYSRENISMCTHRQKKKCEYKNIDSSIVYEIPKLKTAYQ